MKGRHAKADWAVVEEGRPVTLTITMTHTDARELMGLCHRVAGSPTGLRGVFDTMGEALKDLGVRSESVELHAAYGSGYCRSSAVWLGPRKS